MQVSKQGLSLTQSAEGCRLRAYQDTGGVWTIGYGHTLNVRPGQVITQDDAARFLYTDMQAAVRVINEHCLPCTQSQFDALCDFVFNVGAGQFLSSHLYKYHKNGEYEKAAAEFPKWKYDNGKVIRGLIVRRQAERALYSLQEQPEDRQHTDALGRSVQSTAGSVSVSQTPTGVRSSPVLPSPTSSVDRASRSTPSGLLARALAILHKLAEGKAPTEN